MESFLLRAILRATSTELIRSSCASISQRLRDPTRVFVLRDLESKLSTKPPRENPPEIAAISASTLELSTMSRRWEKVLSEVHRLLLKTPKTGSANPRPR